MSTDPARPKEAEPSLRHVLVVGGTPQEWDALSAEQWALRLADLGKVADHAGASWLTLHPHHGEGGSAGVVRTATAGSCVVAASPEGDGRARLVRAINTIAAQHEPITEVAIAAALNSPATIDPDLVVVLGSQHRLPASLVWELAYAELVFIDVLWAELQASHLDDAISSYAQRHRRFGGLD